MPQFIRGVEFGESIRAKRVQQVIGEEVVRLIARIQSDVTSAGISAFRASEKFDEAQKRGGQVNIGPENDKFLSEMKRLWKDYGVVCLAARLGVTVTREDGHLSVKYVAITDGDLRVLLAGEYLAVRERLRESTQAIGKNSLTISRKINVLVGDQQLLPIGPQVVYMGSLIADRFIDQGMLEFMQVRLGLRFRGEGQ